MAGPSSCAAGVGGPSVRAAAEHRTNHTAGPRYKPVRRVVLSFRGHGQSPDELTRDTKHATKRTRPSPTPTGRTAHRPGRRTAQHDPCGGRLCAAARAGAQRWLCKRVRAQRLVRVRPRRHRLASGTGHRGRVPLQPRRQQVADHAAAGPFSSSRASELVSTATPKMAASHTPRDLPPSGPRPARRPTTCCPAGNNLDPGREGADCRRRRREVEDASEGDDGGGGGVPAALTTSGLGPCSLVSSGPGQAQDLSPVGEQEVVEEEGEDDLADEPAAMVARGEQRCRREEPDGEG